MDRRRGVAHFPVMTRTICLLVALVLAASAHAEHVRPKARPAADPIPVTRWDHRSESDRWSRAALKALRSHGERLVRHTPRDIGAWCPGYARAGEVERRAFWVGFLSALAKYESTWKPRAVGGGNQWFGLLQIYPPTARTHGCRARSGQDLTDGGDNLSCAIRIMSRTVPRDGVIHARVPRWSGVAADWAPLRSREKRAEMANWLKAQDYCQISVSPRPQARPSDDALVMGPDRSPMRPVSRNAAILSDVAPPASLDRPVALPATDGGAPPDDLSPRPAGADEGLADHPVSPLATGRGPSRAAR